MARTAASEGRHRRRGNHADCDSLYLSLLGAGQTDTQAKAHGGQETGQRWRAKRTRGPAAHS